MQVDLSREVRPRSVPHRHLKGALKFWRQQCERPGEMRQSRQADLSACAPGKVRRRLSSASGDVSIRSTSMT